MKPIIKKLCMLVTMLSAFTSASAYDFIANGIAYTISSFSNLECAVADADVYADLYYRGDFVIPAEVSYNGKKLTVVSIEDSAFENSAITSVILPKTVRKIGEKSFRNCHSLRIVLFNEELQSIGAEAFSNCTSLQSIQFPQALTTLGESSFKNCSDLREVALPNKLTTLEANTFQGCKKLSSISWGNKIARINDYAFADCGFETFCIPNSVTYIAKSILSRNQNLQNFTIGNGIDHIYHDPIENCPNIKKFIIADGTNSLCLDFSRVKTYNYVEGNYYICLSGAYSSSSFDYVYIGRSLVNPTPEKNDGSLLYEVPPFYGNKNIKTLELGSNVSTLKSVSFSSNNHSHSYGWLEDCSNLEHLRIAGLYSLPESFAENATSLKSVEFSNTTHWICKNAFKGCTSLKTIVFGTNISNIEDNAFSGCDSITSIYCKQNTPPTYNTGFSRNLYLNCNLYIPFETEEFYKQCSPWNNFWNISENSECVSTFLCGNLRYSVISGNDVTIIGNTMPFADKATGICNLRIPPHIEYFSKEYNVVGINENAFKDASSLSSIFIPGSIRYISNDAFSGCSSLNSIEFEYGENPLFIGCNSSLHLSDYITPFPNPSDYDERHTGFRNGHYNGLFYGLPIEHIAINRNIESQTYYEQSGGKPMPQDNYLTVYNNIIYYPPFYELTKLKSIEIGENVSAICKNQIKAIVNAIPVTMDYPNFGKCDNIEIVVSNNPSAPIGGGFSQAVYENASLLLPNGGTASYKGDSYWTNFSNISETPFIAIESISFESDEIVVDTDASIKLMPILNPKNASLKKLSWSSSKPSLVQVSDDGNITTSTREGDATITATASDGTGVSSTIKVIVQKGADVNNIYKTKPIIQVEDGKLHISGKSETDVVEIYNIQGQLVELSKNSVINIKHHGFYIVKIGATSKTVTL